MSAQPDVMTEMASEAAKQSVRILATELFTVLRSLKSPNQLIDTNIMVVARGPENKIDPLRVMNGIKKIVDMRLDVVPEPDGAPSHEMKNMPSHVDQFSQFLIEVFGPNEAFKLLQENTKDLRTAANE